MQKIPIIIILLVGAILVSPGRASEWVSYGADQTGRMLFHRDSVRRPSEDTVTVWTRVIYSEEGKKHYVTNLQPDTLAKYRYNELYNTDALVEIDCHAKKARYLLIENYDTKGAPLYSGNFSLELPSPWHYIEPGSVADELRRMVCDSSTTTSEDDDGKTGGHDPSGSPSNESKQRTWIRIDGDPGQEKER